MYSMIKQMTSFKNYGWFLINLASNTCLWAHTQKKF